MCKWTKPGSASGDNMHRQRGETSCDECRIEVNAYQRGRRARGVVPDRQYQVWAWYRLRWSDYEEMFERQGGVCAVCLQDFPMGRTPHVDHDHSCDHDGKGRKSCASCVRGILCQRCNTGMAMIEDPERRMRALAYLKVGGDVYGGHRS